MEFAARSVAPTAVTPELELPDRVRGKHVRRGG